MRPGVIGTAALSLWLATGYAAADGFDADPMRPVSPATGYFAIDTADVLGPNELALAASLHYARDLLVARDASGAEVISVVDDRAGLQLLADYGLLGRFQLGARLPIIFAQSGDPGLVNPMTEVSSAALGDLRLVGKMQLATHHARWARIGVAASLEGMLPTGDTDSFSGAAGPEIEPRLIASAAESSLSASIHAGYRVRERTELANLVVDDELVLGAAVAGAISPGRLWLIGEAHAAIGVDGDSERERPVELVAGARYNIGGGYLVQGGAGFGVTEGYGAPALRALASVWYRRSPAAAPEPPGDQDGDGIIDPEDRCPTDLEDFDSFEDEDGCPDLDNDGDDIADADDRCPAAMGPKENQGCPDLDEDGDGMVDRLDRCPADAEDLDGFQDDDGCPDLDNDADSIADADDRCPLEAEDIDGFQDDDGCPDTDNDGDGIPDLADACPDEPEAFNGNDDDDGCPDQGKVLAVLTDDKIEIKEQVHFATRKVKISKKSEKLLGTVAKILILHPEIQKMRIEGHTDSRGRDAFNLKLSQARAESVRQHLIDVNGIDPNRLEAVGVGEQSPIADNKSRKGRAANRRVEFVIAERQ